MCRVVALPLLLLCAVAGAAMADPPVVPAPPGLLCRQAIGVAARAHGVPSALMAAVGQVESGRRDPVSGALHPWPWTVDAEGQGTFYDSKPQAIAAVRALQARGMRSIDVGCMQVNLLHHPDAFASLEQAFDPEANADYAARFLAELHGQSGSWTKATALYHSATPALAAEYQRKVMQAWPAEERLAWAGGMVFPAQRAGGPVNASPFPTPMRGAVTPRVQGPGAAAGQPAGRGLDDYRARPITAGWRRLHG